MEFRGEEKNWEEREEERVQKYIRARAGTRIYREEGRAAEGGIGRETGLYCASCVSSNVSRGIWT